MTMHPLVVIPAQSVALVLDRSQKEPRPIVTPTVLINYPSEASDELAEKLLKPYANPDRCFVGINLTGAVVRISAYVVLAIPYNVGLETSDFRVPGPCVCLIGSDTEVSIDGITRFMPHYEEQKKFDFGIGYQTGPKPVTGSIINPKIWRVELTSMHGSGLRDAIRSAIITAGSAPTAEWN